MTLPSNASNGTSVEKPLDGISAPQATPRQDSSSLTQSSPSVQRMKLFLIGACALFYLLYGGWSVLLLAALPSPDPAFQRLPFIGLVIAVSVGCICLGIGVFMLRRIAISRADAGIRLQAFVKTVVVLLPAIGLSLIVPLVTMRTLPIELKITSPSSGKDLVAPVSMTFSVEHALPGLASQGFVPVEYRWDVNSDKKTDQETAVPELTATFERDGSYTVAVVMMGSDGIQKSAAKRFAINQSVFKVTPSEPIVDQAVVFSLAHLYPKEGVVKEVRWDFNDDDVVDATTASLETAHTYFQVGTVTVKADVSLQNNTQTSFTRSVNIIEPPPLPFPVTLTTEPKTLIGSPPFPVLFAITTESPPAKVEWNFGDGAVDEGQKVAHTFDKKGLFPVNVKVHSHSGVIANLQSTVRMVDVLRLPDLTFEGTPTVSGNRIEGEVPVSLNLTPRTATPFVQFAWEAPEATEVGTTETSLQAIYRREGTYTVTLIAQDLEDHVLRLPITVVVKPAREALVISMSPETGVAPLDVAFDASESYIPGETITGFVWNFGDSTPEQFGGASANHRYEKEGTYTIGLTVRTTSGKNFTARSTLVVREPLLRACITPSRIRGSIPMGVDFSSDCTVGAPSSYLWDFGDGAQSDQKNVIHVFEKAGTYPVKLTVTQGSATHTVSVSITAQP